MKLGTYLQRIGCARPLSPDLDSLRRLHRAHMEAVPFENLDIPLGRPLSLDPADLFDKIVTRHRGGFCYELNGLFAWLLTELGFHVKRLSARVFGEQGPGPDFDHMLLLVDFDQPVIADVGFGDSFIEPLPLDGREYAQMPGHFRAVADGDTWTLQRRRAGSDWEPQYVCTLKPWPLDAFEAMCHYQQTSPESSFTRKSVCSRATHDGRITLANGRLIVTTAGEREERDVPDPAEALAILVDRFGVRLTGETRPERALRGKFA